MATMVPNRRLREELARADRLAKQRRANQFDDQATVVPTEDRVPEATRPGHLRDFAADIVEVQEDDHIELNTGDIQKPTQYGAASVLAFEANAGVDYSLTPNIFIRGLAGIQTMGYTFKGDPMSKANNRDNDGTTQEVMGARDTYFGGSVTLGYAY